jgi:anti-sigma B factor antagonist
MSLAVDWPSAWKQWRTRSGSITVAVRKVGAVVSDDQHAADAVLPTAVVLMPAEIDVANASDLAARLDTAIHPGVKAIVIDMSLTTFCDSMGVKVIARIRGQAVAEGVDLRLVTASAQVRRILAVTGLDTKVRIYRRLEDALRAGSKPSGKIANSQARTFRPGARKQS